MLDSNVEANLVMDFIFIKFQTQKKENKYSNNNSDKKKNNTSEVFLERDKYSVLKTWFY